MLLLATAGAAPVPVSGRPSVPCSPPPAYVLFDWRSVAFDGEARMALDGVEYYRTRCTEALVTVTGHNDASESPVMSRMRAIAVRDYIVAHGYPAEYVMVSWVGSTDMRVPTAAGTRERQNRVVTIDYGPLPRTAD